MSATAESYAGAAQAAAREAARLRADGRLRLVRDDAARGAAHRAAGDRLVSHGRDRSRGFRADGRRVRAVPRTARRPARDAPLAPGPRPRLRGRRSSRSTRRRSRPGPAWALVVLAGVVGITRAAAVRLSPLALAARGRGGARAARLRGHVADQPTSARSPAPRSPGSCSRLPTGRALVVCAVDGDPLRGADRHAAPARPRPTRALSRCRGCARAAASSAC